MKTASYTRYLEAVVASLLAERDDRDRDIISAELTHPSFSGGVRFSPINVRSLIREMQVARDEPYQTLNI